MSVEIYDVDNVTTDCVICIPVVRENKFNSIWMIALSQLNIKRFGNGVWLYSTERSLSFSVVQNYFHFRQTGVLCPWFFRGRDAPFCASDNGATEF
ncbi:hypothetical protein VSQ48_06945 [Candidatus Ventrimonas sp. KK005]